MRACLVLFAALAASVSATEGSVKTVQVLGESKGVEILVGVLEGIVGDIGNVKDCIHDSEEVGRDFDDFAHDLEDAMNRHSTPDLIAAFKRLGGGMEYLVLAADQCHAIKIAEDIRNIIAQLAVPGGWIRVVGKDAWEILIHGHSVTVDIEDAIREYHAGQWNAFGRHIGGIVGYLL